MLTVWNSVKRYRVSAALAALGLLLIIFGSFSWSVSRDRIEASLKLALKKDTAYSLVSFEQAHISWFPWPVLDIADLRLIKEASSQERVSVEKLRVRLNLGSWLLGYPRIVEMQLTKPIVHFASSENLNETEAVSTLVLNFLRSSKRPELRALRIADAQLLLDGKPWVDDLFIKVQNIATTDFRLFAQAQYRAIPIALVAEIAQGTSPEGRGIDWRLQLPGLTSSFKGRLFGSKSLDADGFSMTDITDGKNYATALGFAPSIARILSKLTLAGDTKITWPTVQIRNAVLQLDQNKLDGSVELSLEKKPRLSATLGAESVDLNPRISDWLNHASKTPDNGSDSLDWLNSAQADVRISADRVLVGNLAFGQVALASQLREGRLDLILSEAKLKDGSLRGRSQIRRLDTDIVSRNSLQFDQIDLETAQEITGGARMKGTATGQIVVEAKGKTIESWMRSLDGKGNVTIRNGELAGLDLERLLTRLDRNTPPIIGASGSTRFRTLRSDFSLSKGEVTLANSALSTLGLSAPITGTIDISRQMFDLRVGLRPQIAIPRLNDAAIKINGPWSRPVFTPEMQPPTNRS